MGPESRVEYMRHLNSWLEDTEAWCRSKGAGYLFVRNDWDIERILLDTLRRRKVLA